MRCFSSLITLLLALPFRPVPWYLFYSPFPSNDVFPVQPQLIQPTSYPPIAIKTLRQSNGAPPPLSLVQECLATAEQKEKAVNSYGAKDGCGDSGTVLGVFIRAHD